MHYQVVLQAFMATGDVVAKSVANTNIGIAAGVGVPIALIVGFIIGWYVAMRMFKKQLKENPPISEKQVRDMYAQMGRKPSEKQIKQIMSQFKKNNT